MKHKWDLVKTKHGYQADEVISSLQKSIRRGEEEQAVFWGYEMMVSSRELSKKFWERVRVISVEDVGLANPTLISIVVGLNQNYDLMVGKEDAFLQGLIAVLLLVRSSKSRYVDELYNNLKEKIEKENYRLNIQDFALDKHTSKGEEMKRDDLHFWTESIKLKNDISKNDKLHLNEILNRIKNKKRP